MRTRIGIANGLEEQTLGRFVKSERAQRARARAWIREQLAKGSDGFRFVVRESRILTRILKNPAAPWTAKVVAACSVGYIFSPIQLIPSFIPVIGQLDDLSVLFVGLKLIRSLTPASVMAECEDPFHSNVSRTSIFSSTF